MCVYCPPKNCFKQSFGMRLQSLVLLTVFCWTDLGKANGSLEEVQQFLTDNGHRYVDVFHNSVWSELIPKDIFLSRRSLVTLGRGNKTKDNKFAIFLFDSDKDNMEEFLALIQERPIRKSLLLFTNPQNYRNKLNRILTKMKLRTFFYLAVSGADKRKLSWYQVISLSSGYVIDKLSFCDSSYLIIEKFNLNGLKVTSTTLDWVPYYKIKDCNEHGVNCTTYGYLKDYMEILARRYNFTFISHKSSDNDWGSIPKDGKWTGVLGDVVSKKFDLSISSWSWKIERIEVLQFVAVAKTRFAQVLTPLKPTTDPGLFARVFTSYSWLAITSTVGVSMICIAFQKCIIPSENTNGEKVFNFTMFLFFVIINSYFSGALTMFFAGTTSIPFETVIDVIRAHPDWSYWIRDTAEIVFYYRFLEKEPDFVTYWERYLADKSGHTYNTDKEALEIMSRGQNVVHTDESKFIGYLNSNPTDQKLHFFGQEPWEQRCLVFPYNSPLVPILDQGARYLREKGIEHQLYIKWIGHRSETADSLSDTMVLTIGQTMTTFLFLSGTFCLTLVLFCGECLFDVIHRKHHRCQDFICEEEEGENGTLTDLRIKNLRT